MKRVPLFRARERLLRPASEAARLRPVHRWLSILLLVLLPLQFAWAQAVDYDSHGSGSHEMHFGHHDHGHGDPHDIADGGTDTGEPQGDADGHHCHGQCSAMPAPVYLVALVMNSTSPDIRIDVRSGAHAPPRPERPQWRPLA